MSTARGTVIQRNTLRSCSARVYHLTLVGLVGIEVGLVDWDDYGHAAIDHTLILYLILYQYLTGGIHLTRGKSVRYWGMNKLLADVVTFMKTFGQPVISQPHIPSKDRQALRIELIEEELIELREAFDAKDIVGVADALTDLLYVVNGCVVECGLKDYIDACHDEVQASNMSKLDEDGKPIYRIDGKVLKGPNFFSPNLEKIINGN